MKKTNNIAMPSENMIDLEYQYSPSRWSKRLSAEAVISAHVDFVSGASKEAKESIPFEVLHYGEGENQLIDLFGTSLPNDSPLLVYIHGGYWQDLERSISAYLVPPLFKKGVRVAVVGYDLVPKATFARIVQEIEELDTFLISWSSKKGTKCIWYAGHSAGAYLTAAILKRRSQNESITSNFPIRGMIFVSGIYDLLPLVETYVNNKLKLSSLLCRCEVMALHLNSFDFGKSGAKWGAPSFWVNISSAVLATQVKSEKHQIREEAQRWSLTEIEIKSFSDMKFLIVVAENDSDEFHRQSSEFYKMLHRQNSTVEYLVIKQTDHFDVVEKLNDEHYVLTQKIVNLVLEK